MASQTAMDNPLERSREASVKPTRHNGSARNLCRQLRRERFGWFTVRQPIPLWAELSLGVLSWLGFLLLWSAIIWFGWANQKLLPYPTEVASAWWHLVTERAFLGDVWISVKRIVYSFGLACAFAAPLGVLMGSFKIVESIFNPLVAPARYLPAPSFAPLLLMWLGTGNNQKLALLFIGVVWFLVTLIMDHVKRADPALLDAAKTLGCGRWQTLWRVIIPEAGPGMVVAMRQMLAVSWTYLVIAEIIAATDGIGAMMMRAKRFVRTDDIMAGIVTIGILGIVFDLLFRLIHRWCFPHEYLGGRGG